MSVAMDNFEHAVATILYVDDEEMARKYFVRSVGAGFEVLTASDADTAIEILQDKNRQIGIVVTDYRMPGRNGGDLLRQIEREFPYVVRILVTAYADREVLLDTVNSSEVFRIIEKPLDLDEVRNTLRLAGELSRERSARQQKLMAIDETLAFLAHELNTPLATIINFARGVQCRVADRSASPQQQTEIGKAALAMDDNARYCLSLLSTFVESVQGAGALFNQHSGSTAQQMILSLLDTYPLTSVQRASIHLDIQEDFRIITLPNCIALVLSSILSNALRALHDHPSPMIRFTVLIEEHPQIRIADNGPGIPPDILERLLVDSVTTHANSGGKGWGMIFCKRIMQSFSGSILIRSSPDIHTDVTLNFPTINNQVKRSAQ
ncbi:Histidine kinase [Candidatus Nitrotoga sp. 1052]|nr:Histidine kinase [Candidatus Nitrotoga sp. 1052]